LAQALAGNGFIVAAVDHWGNTYDNKIPPEFVRPWQRPLDISFILTALLADPLVGPVIDRNRIGAIGFSYGGYTVLALAGAVADYPTMLHAYKTVDRKEMEVPEMPGLIHLLEDSTIQEQTKHIPMLKDKRIRAFFAISPGVGPGFVNRRQMATIDRPVFIVGSQSDSIAPVRTNAANYHRLIAGSGYYEFPGRTGHYVMLGEANDQLKKSWPTGFLDDPSVDRHAVHLKVDSLAVDFFKAKL
jgi:predicted dienelactone hydrolase